MRDTIELAREAGFETMLRKEKILGFDRDGDYTEELKAFESLVRADEQDKYKWDIHSCGPTCTKVACVAMRKAIETEREACADIVENAHTPDCGGWDAQGIADAIRARGNT
jgi:hypothetical protein